MTSCSDSDAERNAAVYDPTANGLATYALACQLAREGHEGLREWFSEQGRPGSGAEEAQSPADLGRRGVAPVRVTTKPAQSDDYAEFLASKAPRAQAVGLGRTPEISSHLFPFQADVASFALRVGRCGVFLDTGLGKTRVQLEFCRHAAEATNGRALILTPLAVARQIEREAVACGYEAQVIREQADVRDGISICNYDRLDKIDPDAFGTVSLDESSILKSFTGKTTRALISAFRAHRFKMAATATPAPNDHMEIGQHAEFLSVMASNEMLARWFTSDQTQMGRYRLKGHGVVPFWDWMASWARMASLPNDLGYSDDGYILPEIAIRRHKVGGAAVRQADGSLFANASSATEIHDVKRQTSEARADAIAAIVAREPSEPWVVWCDTDYEADALTKRLAGAVEVRGSHPVERKEERLAAFASGEARVLVTKPSICGYGLNWQHCASMAFVGRTFSYEAYYQAVRRCWRFGQRKPVHVHIAVADGEDAIGRVIDRKAADHERMKLEMAAAMRRATGRSSAVKVDYHPTHNGRLPSWLSAA